MKSAVFGASGRKGRLLVEGALEEGHQVRAFVRGPSKTTIQYERLRVIEGDVEDTIGVEEAIAGTEAVLSALGHAKTSAKDVQNANSSRL